ncbi:hypothetical protein [uncultured Desulfobacter sp.]|uniref:hypothetical protein n=1 Tax=uncultured Desulfobacter sp. TaxID=240139 RepID=UPI002AA9453A|nr:hypothetical protein [uncultured Desulfobacter sp.]
MEHRQIGVDAENSKTAVIFLLLRPDRSAEPDLNGAAAQTGGEFTDRPSFHWWLSICRWRGNEGLTFFAKRGGTIKQPWAALGFNAGQPKIKFLNSRGEEIVQAALICCSPT